MSSAWFSIREIAVFRVFFMIRASHQRRTAGMKAENPVIVGAEEGTRTRAGFPPLPQAALPLIRHFNPFVYRIITTMPKLHIP